VGAAAWGVRILAGLATRLLPLITRHRARALGRRDARGAFVSLGANATARRWAKRLAPPPAAPGCPRRPTCAWQLRRGAMREEHCPREPQARRAICRLNSRMHHGAAALIARVLRHRPPVRHGVRVGGAGAEQDARRHAERLVWVAASRVPQG
jgi:hypothetical protein